jgi:hypothetical protein
MGHHKQKYHKRTKPFYPAHPPFTRANQHQSMNQSCNCRWKSQVWTNFHPLFLRQCHYVSDVGKWRDRNTSDMFDGLNGNEPFTRTVKVKQRVSVSLEAIRNGNVEISPKYTDFSRPHSNLQSIWKPIYANEVPISRAKNRAVENAPNNRKEGYSPYSFNDSMNRYRNMQHELSQYLFKGCWTNRFQEISENSVHARYSPSKDLSCCAYHTQ